MKEAEQFYILLTEDAGCGDRQCQQDQKEAG